MKSTTVLGGISLTLALIFIINGIYSYERLASSLAGKCQCDCTSPNSLVSQKISEKNQTQITRKPGYHFVFNIDCYNYKQNWQSFMLFYTFLLYYDEFSGSTLTELVSCKNLSYVSPWKEKLPSHVFTQTVADFQILRPDIVKESPYWPYNKPLALKQWLDSGKAPDENAFVVVIDPDFMFLRPLSREFQNITVDQIVANHYDLGDWSVYPYISEVCNRTKNCTELPKDKKQQHSVGVPNIMHMSTLQRIVDNWFNYTVMIKATGKGGWSDEQFAYIFSVVMANVEHIKRTDLMVSHAKPGTTNKQTNKQANKKSKQKKQTKINKQQKIKKRFSTSCSIFFFSIEWGEMEWSEKTPHYFIHYCQDYQVGNNKEWSWAKHDFHKDAVFKCENPPMQLAPNLPGFARQGWFAVVISQNFLGAWKWWKQLFC